MGAEEVCQRVWSVPAEVASIDFTEQGESLNVQSPPRLVKEGRDGETIQVLGWNVTQHSATPSTNATESAASQTRLGGLPVLWTPSIKALWAPFIPLPAMSSPDAQTALPLHELRLSGSSLRIHVCGQPSSDELGVPLPLGFS